MILKQREIGITAESPSESECVKMRREEDEPRRNLIPTFFPLTSSCYIIYKGFCSFASVATQRSNMREQWGKKPT